MFPRVKLGTLPTPLHPLQKVSEEVGTEVWIKRDDLTGYALGGNKVREAEFLLADAVQQGADIVITAGTIQSNHVRVIAAAAGRLSIQCHLFLSGELPEQPSGNLLLDYLAQADIHVVPSRADRGQAMDSFAESLRKSGGKPYIIPVGGANAVGAYGYVSGFQELDDQVRSLQWKPTTLLFASSTGTTYAGTLVGKSLTNSQVRLLGIDTDLDPDARRAICSIANDLAERLGIAQRFQPGEVALNSDYVGGGFGIPTDEGSSALRRLWQLEGILLDPVYTAKAMAGLISLAEQGNWRNERVIFLHTGGTPTTFSSSVLSHLGIQATAGKTHQ